MTHKEAIQRLKEEINEYTPFADKWDGARLDIEALSMAIQALEQTQWIPIKFRPITEEEKQWHEDWYDGADILECPLPDDGQEVLITCCGETEMDTFINDGIECYFENRDISDVKAWMPKPKPYREEVSE